MALNRASFVAGLVVPTSSIVYCCFYCLHSFARCDIRITETYLTKYLSSMSRNLSVADLNHEIKNAVCSNSNGVNIVHVNACRLFKKLTYLNGIISDSNISAVCVSETWFSDNHTNLMVRLGGFKVHRGDRRLGGKSGGGVAIYVSDQITSKLITKSKADHKVEFIFIEICASNTNILLGCVYNPPSNKDLSKLFESIDLNVDKYSNIVISGDFNLNLLKPDSHVSNFLRKLTCLNLSVVNSKPTHFVPRRTNRHQESNSCLDLFITADTTKVACFAQFPVSKLSHHDLIILCYKAPLPCLVKRDSYYRNYSKISMDALLTDLYSQQWSNIYTSSDVNTMLNFFVETLKHLVNKHVPLCLIRPSKPFVLYSVELNRANVNRDMAHRQWRRTGLDEDWRLFQHYRDIANKAENHEWKKHFREKCSNRVDKKDLWSEINKLGFKNDPQPAVVFTSEELNSYFLGSCDVGSNNNTATPPLLRQNRFAFTNATATEVHKAIISIKSKAVGHDEISPKFILLLLPHLIYHITHIFNCILTTSVYPAIWKRARVCPIPKVNDPKTHSDYRPISILPYLSKAFERLMHAQITNYIYLKLDFSRMNNLDSGAIGVLKRRF